MLPGLPLADVGRRSAMRDLGLWSLCCIEAVLRKRPLKAVDEGVPKFCCTGVAARKCVPSVTARMRVRWSVAALCSLTRPKLDASIGRSTFHIVSWNGALIPSAEHFCPPRRATSNAEADSASRGQDCYAEEVRGRPWLLRFPSSSKEPFSLSAHRARKR